MQKFKSILFFTLLFFCAQNSPVFCNLGHGLEAVFYMLAGPPLLITGAIFHAKANAKLKKAKNPRTIFYKFLPDGKIRKLTTAKEIETARKKLYDKGQDQLKMSKVFLTGYLGSMSIGGTASWVIATPFFIYIIYRLTYRRDG